MYTIDRRVAQLEEHWSEEPSVVGSIPTPPARVSVGTAFFWPNHGRFSLEIIVSICDNTVTLLGYYCYSGVTTKIIQLPCEVIDSWMTDRNSICFQLNNEER